MGEISVRELRELLRSLEDRLESEGELLLTRRGKPIARILPVERRRGASRPSHADLRASIRPLATGSERHVRADREER